MEKDLQGMKAQADGLSKEYDRILDENERLQVCYFVLTSPPLSYKDLYL